MIYAAFLAVYSTNFFALLATETLPMTDYRDQFSYLATEEADSTNDKQRYSQKTTRRTETTQR